MHPLAARRQFETEVAAISPRLLELRGWTLNSTTYPLVDITFTAVGRKTLRLHVQCEDWNSVPPGIVLLDAEGTLLTRGPNCPKSVFNNSAHPVTGRPFICMRGSREYHTHPSHVSDAWEPLRTLSDYTLFNIIGQVWSAWQKTTDQT